MKAASATRITGRTRLLLALVAAAVGVVVAMVVAEVWIRATWNPRRGVPGFYVSDPVRLERLGTSYSGWFAGVPVRLNSLGFRDDREFDLARKPGTFRILVLGDSVTFGHGSVYAHTYPYLLEQRLRAWRPSVDWEVWNLGVPGYNTTQELAYLMDVGPAYQPDLVIVGFFANDLSANYELAPPTRSARLRSTALNVLRGHMYSLEWYRKVFALLRGNQTLRADPIEVLLSRVDVVADAREQALTHPEPVGALAFERSRCRQTPVTVPADPEADEPGFVLAAQSDPGLRKWKQAVKGFQDLARSGAYRIVFFVNHAPGVCEGGEDLFDPRATTPVNDYFLRQLSQGTPAVSPHDRFARYRPSEMPGAGGHSLGNANQIKADVLGEFLESQVLPAALQERPRASGGR